MSRRHKKPWVKKTWTPKPCTPTKSRSQPFVARVGNCIADITQIYRGRYSYSTKPFDGYTLASTTQSFTSECSSKYVETKDVVWDGESIDFSYPRFKNCKNERSDLGFLPGLEFTHHDWNTNHGVKVNDIFYAFHGNFILTDRLPTTIARASSLGYVKSPFSFESSSAATLALKQKLLTDNALLNFREVFSVLTFFAELKDIKSLPKLLRKWTKTTHDVSDKFLGISFGVLPFYSDLMSIMQRLNNLGSAIDEWNAAAQECNTRAYHVTVPLGAGLGDETAPGVFVNDVNFVSSYSVAGGNPCPVIARTISVQHVKCKAHLYLIPRAIPQHLIGELKRRIWGTNTFLSTAWELVPFSFVVDWFLKIGSIINEFEKAEPLLQYRILNAGYSLKVDTHVIHTQGRTLEDGDFGTLTLHHTLYKRVNLPTADLLTPGKTYELGFHTIDGNQALLGTALLHQLLR